MPVFCKKMCKSQNVFHHHHHHRWFYSAVLQGFIIVLIFRFFHIRAWKFCAIFANIYFHFYLKIGSFMILLYYIVIIMVTLWFLQYLFLISFYSDKEIYITLFVFNVCNFPCEHRLIILSTRCYFSFCCFLEPFS